MSFSAGARVTTGAALGFDLNSRPGFDALIYPVLVNEMIVSQNAPPILSPLPMMMIGLSKRA